MQQSAFAACVGIVACINALITLQGKCSVAIALLNEIPYFGCDYAQDIDNEPIEQALLKQLDDATIGMISEFFTEIHFNITEMREDFKESGKIKLPVVVNELHEFRNRGLRIHYWP